MIDFCALTSPNVQKIYIMLEECGLPYKENFVDVWKGDQYKPEFSKINPNNKIPAIVDHEGPGGKPYTVIESGAILLYLAEKTGKFLQGPAKEIRRDPVADGQGHRRRPDVRAMDPLQAVRAEDRQRLFDGPLHSNSSGSTRCWSSPVALSQAATNTRSPTSRPSVDPNHDAQGVKWEDNPNLARWFNAINERPAVKAALAKSPVIKSNREPTSDDDKDASSTAAASRGRDGCRRNRPRPAAASPTPPTTASRCSPAIFICRRAPGRPALVAVHGGGWQAGARAAFHVGPGSPSAATCCRDQLPAGEEGPEDVSQAVHDVLAAVQFVRGNAPASSRSTRAHRPVRRLGRRASGLARGARRGAAIFKGAYPQDARRGRTPRSGAGRRLRRL